MKALRPSVLALSLIAFPFAGAGVAKKNDSITVNLADLASGLAIDFDVEEGDLPQSVPLSADAAATACGLAVSDFDSVTSCDAVVVTSALSAALRAELSEDDTDMDDDDDDDDDDDGPGSDNPNSASQFAPGHQDGPASESAPGHQDGPARESAPGQMKKKTHD